MHNASLVHFKGGKFSQSKGMLDLARGLLKSKLNENNIEYIKVTLKIDDQLIVSKSNTKNKARIKVCKKAIKILHPNENILFF